MKIARNPFYLLRPGATRVCRGNGRKACQERGCGTPNRAQGSSSLRRYCPDEYGANAHSSRCNMGGGTERSLQRGRRRRVETQRTAQAARAALISTVDHTNLRLATPSNHARSLYLEMTHDPILVMCVSIRLPTEGQLLLPRRHLLTVRPVVSATEAY